MTRWLGRFLSSSIGRKVVMAVTGLALFGFLVVHLAGNLTLYAGDDAFNGYAAKLEANPLLPLAEAVLAAIFLAHVVFAVLLVVGNRRARRHGYRTLAPHGGRTVASTTMWVTGPLLLVFLVVHVLDFRLPHLLQEDHDLAQAVRARLGSPVGFVVYTAAMFALGLHLWHAFQSAFQTVGVGHPRYRAAVAWIGRALAVVLFLGFLSFPLYLFLGA